MHTVPFITIVVPSFNAGHCIRNCLDSISKQTFDDYEVLIVDGQSTDDTSLVIKSYSQNDTRIRCVSEKDNGIYDAMNKSINIANGEWLFFLGSDDKLYDFDVLQKVAIQLRSSEADFVYGNVKVKGDLLWAKDGDVYDGEFTVKKLFHHNICHQCIFYRKKIFEKLGKYNIDYKITADWDLNHRCFASGQVQYIDDIIADFHAGGNSTVNTNDRFTDHDMVLNLRKYHHISYFDRLYKRYDWIFFNLAIDYMNENKYHKSLYYLFFSAFHASRKISILRHYLSRLLKFS